MLSTINNLSYFMETLLPSQYFKREHKYIEITVAADITYMQITNQ